MVKRKIHVCEICFNVVELGDDGAIDLSVGVHKGHGELLLHHFEHFALSLGLSLRMISEIINPILSVLLSFLIHELENDGLLRFLEEEIEEFEVVAQGGALVAKRDVV